jgi:hypothetical protein
MMALRASQEEPPIVLDFLRPGDLLMVIRIDRPARSTGDLTSCAR